MAEKKQPAKKPAPKPSVAKMLPSARKPAPHTKEQETASDLAKAILPAVARRMSSNKGGKTAKGEPNTQKLSKQQVDAIRLFALTLAGPELPSDAVLICNPVSEPSPLPQSELLYDTCKWCDIDIYYDRMMPSRPDLTRVCIRCGIMLMEAEKKGGN